MNINITPFETSDAKGVRELFNRHCESELIYAPWSEETFKQLFTENEYFRSDLTFVAKKEDDIIAFANGVYHEKINVGFITMVIVDKEYRRQNIGSQLLEKVEVALKQFNPVRIDCSFFNPIKLTWYVPNTNNHEHNNAPGVPFPSDAHKFFLKHGYQVITQENAYHLDLNQFKMPEDIQKRIDELEKEGITFEYFDNSKHRFEDLFDQLGNELWREEITEAVTREEPLSVLVPIKDDQALGFTGPIYPEPSGRGYFAGIGIHPKAQGKGIGKALFFLLCQHEKQLGADYMTLFTGETNPARRMYEAAGFDIAHSFKIMRKQLNK